MRSGATIALLPSVATIEAATLSPRERLARCPLGDRLVGADVLEAQGEGVLPGEPDEHPEGQHDLHSGTVATDDSADIFEETERGRVWTS